MENADTPGGNDKEEGVKQEAGEDIEQVADLEQSVGPRNPCIPSNYYAHIHMYRAMPY